jgi:hypothetical protein
MSLKERFKMINAEDLNNNDPEQKYYINYVCNVCKKEGLAIIKKEELFVSDIGCVYTPIISCCKCKSEDIDEDMLRMYYDPYWR